MFSKTEWFRRNLQAVPYARPVRHTRPRIYVSRNVWPHVSSGTAFTVSSFAQIAVCGLLVIRWPVDHLGGLAGWHAPNLLYIEIP